MDHHHQIRRPQRSCSSSSTGARTSSRLEFFKVFLPNFSSNELLIPPEFVRQLKSRSRTIPNKAILKDRNGQEWNVGLTKKAHRLFIKEGWKDFVNCWSLEFGDFLIFRYYRKKLTFSVKVFARNGCLKELDVISLETSEDRPPTPDIDKNIPDVVEVKSDDDEEENVTQGGEIRRRRPARVCNKKYLSLNLENLKKSRTSSFNKQITTLPQSLVIKETAPAPVKCNVPKHPHFVAVMSKITTRILFLPAMFLKKHNIQLKPQVILQDEKGSQWPIKIDTLYEAQRVTMTDGWSEFWRSNNLKAGDNCVFEFVLEDENRCEEIHVQICEAGLKTQRCNRYLVVVP